MKVSGFSRNKCGKQCLGNWMELYTNMVAVAVKMSVNRAPVHRKVSTKTYA